MNEFDDLEQKLWELEYGLLPDEEAAALRARIAAEPQIASAHRRVVAHSALVAQAARIEVPRIPLQRSAPPTVSIEPLTKTAGKPSAMPSEARSLRTDYRRVVNWAIAAAASLLLALLGFAAIQDERSQTQPLAYVVEQNKTNAVQETKFVKIEVVGPPTSQQGLSNRFDFETTRDGVPQATELNVQLADSSGNVKLDTVIPTDKKGRGSLVMPAEFVAVVSKMEIAEVNQSNQKFAVPLVTAPETYTTFLTTDRPRYRPGDTVRFRSVTLSRFGLQADRDMEVQYAVTDPAGNAIPSANQAGMTTKGVGNGELAVTPEFAAGEYTVVAQNPANLFPTARHDFYVQADQPRQWNVDVNWADSDYDPGASPQAKVVVRTLDGKPAADLPIRTEAYVDGHQVAIPNAPQRTTSRGEVDLSFQLPGEIAFGEGSLNVAPGNEEFQIERIPIRVPKLEVDFYPEGGDLVAGLPSRVYFHAHDPLGRPAEIRGKLVDANGNEVADLSTQHEGRGEFQLTPQPAVTYKVQIAEPKQEKQANQALQATVTSTFPPVNDQGRIVLYCGKGVFEANDAVVPRIHSKLPPPDHLTVVAKCRDAMVGHASVSSADFSNGNCDVPLQLAAETAGVVRITVFERDQPLAERLIYRQPASRLSVQIEGGGKSYSPASQVQLGIACINEKGDPAAAALGVGVVDDAVLKLARPAPPRLATHFWLLGDVDSPEKLEDANFYVADSAESRTALDLLLGTQGWRRFERVSESRLAVDDLRMQDAYAMGMSAAKQQRKAGTQEISDLEGGAEYRFHDALYDRTADLPFRIDNSSLLAEQEQQLKVLNPEPDPFVRPSRARSSIPWENLWFMTIAAALGVMALSLIALFLRLASNRRLAIAATILSAIVLFLATISSFSHPSAETAAVATSAEPAAGETADRFYSKALKGVPIDESTREGALTENTPVPTTSPAPSASASQPTTWAAPASDSPADPGAASRADRDLKQQMDVATPRPEPAREPAPAAAALPPAPVAAPAAAPPAPAAAPPATAPPVPKASLVEELAPAKPGLAGGAGGALGGMQPAPDMKAPAMRSVVPTRPEPEAPREKATEKTLSQSEGRLEAESMVRQRLADAIEQGARVNRLRRAEKKDAQQSQSRRTELELQKEIKPEAEAKRSDEAEALLSKDKSNANDFLVRRYAYQRSLERPENKKEKVPDYRETLYWNPLLITDANGRAEVVFDLSDGVSTYRVLIDGHANGRITSATGEIKAE